MLILYREGFGKKTFLMLQSSEPGSGRLHGFGFKASASLLRFSPDAARGDIRLAIGLAATVGLAFVKGAGQAIDQPGAVIGRPLDGNVASAERGDKCGQQDCGR